MDMDIKDLLLNIQSEIGQINNKLEKIEKIAANGNYALIDMNNKQDKDKD